MPVHRRTVLAALMVLAVVGGAGPAAHAAATTGVAPVTVATHETLGASGSTAMREPLQGDLPGARPVPGRVVAPFRAPAHRYAPGHRGVDLAAVPGAHVAAARDGTVRWAGDVAGTGYVSVDHGRGLETTYGDVDPLVGVGQRVRAGQVIGRLRPGRSHLDWGARWHRGGHREYVDPLLLLRRLRPVLVAHVD